MLSQCPRFRQNDSNRCSNRTGYVRQSPQINDAHETGSSLSLFLIFLSLCYTQSSGQTGSLWLSVWAANLVFSQGDSCSVFIKECDCPHLVRAALGTGPSLRAPCMGAPLPLTRAERCCKRKGHPLHGSTAARRRSLK